MSHNSEHSWIGYLFFCFIAAAPPCLEADAQVIGQTPLNTRQVMGPPFFNGIAWPASPPKGPLQFDSAVLLQIDGVYERLEVPMDAISIITSNPVIEKAAKSSLNLDSTKTRQSIHVAVMYTGSNRARLEVRLHETEGVEWKPGDSEKLIASLVQGLRDSMDESTKATIRAKEQFAQRIEAEISSTSARLEAARKAKSDLEDKQRTIPYHFRNRDWRDIDSQTEQMKEDLRRLEEQYAALSPPPDPVITEREQLVRLLEEKLSRMKEEKKAESEIKEVESKLDEARQMLESSRKDSPRAEKNMYRTTERDRLKKMIDLQKKKQEELQDVIKKLKSEDFASLGNELNRATANEEYIRNELSQLNSRRQSAIAQTHFAMSYIVTIIDGVPDAQTP